MFVAAPTFAETQDDEFKQLTIKLLEKNNALDIRTSRLFANGCKLQTAKLFLKPQLLLIGLNHVAF